MVEMSRPLPYPSVALWVWLVCLNLVPARQPGAATNPLAAQRIAYILNGEYSAEQAGGHAWTRNASDPFVLPVGRNLAGFISEATPSETLAQMAAAVRMDDRAYNMAVVKAFVDLGSEHVLVETKFSDDTKLLMHALHALGTECSRVTFKGYVRRSGPCISRVFLVQGGALTYMLRPCLYAAIASWPA